MRPKNPEMRPRGAKEPRRGRPRTLDRERVLDVAVRSYRDEGVVAVSLNEVCRRAQVSKPGVYREFGSEDGLMAAALERYNERKLGPLRALAEDDSATLRETLDALVTLVVPEGGGDEGDGRGCLLVAMRGALSGIGPETRARIVRADAQLLELHGRWLRRAEAAGELAPHAGVGLAARYVHAQVAGAMLLLAQGEERGGVREMLGLALSVLVVPGRAVAQSLPTRST